MKKLSKKSVIMILAVSLAVLLTLGGTFAYLFSVTEPVKNNFNPNEIGAELEETTDQEFNILPGTEETKDPTITLETTTAAYVYVKVEDNTQGLVTWTIADGWTQLLDANGQPVEGVYYREVDGENSPYTFHVLKDDKVSYASSLTGEQIKAGVTAAGADGLSLTFTGYAIQKVPFNDPYLAWQELNAEPEPANP